MDVTKARGNESPEMKRILLLSQLIRAARTLYAYYSVRARQARRGGARPVMRGFLNRADLMKRDADAWAAEIDLRIDADAKGDPLPPGGDVPAPMV